MLDYLFENAIAPLELTHGACTVRRPTHQTTHKLTQRFFKARLLFLLKPLPCLSFALSDDTRLEFTRSCWCSQTGRVCCVVQICILQPLTRTIWCLFSPQSSLYPFISLYLFTPSLLCDLLHLHLCYKDPV